jgi:hypothetical protein
MKRSLFILVVVLGCFSCREFPNQEIIYGRWRLNKIQVNYPGIELSSDSIIIMRSRADTIYSHKYYIKDSNLNIIMPDNEVVANKIKKLTIDSLILETLLENKEEQIYIRYK